MTLSARLNNSTITTLNVVNLASIAPGALFIVMPTRTFGGFSCCGFFDAQLKLAVFIDVVVEFLHHVTLYCTENDL